MQAASPPAPPTATISVGRDLRTGLPFDQQVTGLQKAGRWGELADLFEGMSPGDRGQRLGVWLEALKKAQRWERLQGVLQAALPQLEAGGRVALPERLLLATAREHLGMKQAAFEGAMEVGALGSPLGFLMAGHLAVSVLRDDWLERAADALCAKHDKMAEGWTWKGEILFRAGRYGEAEAPLRKGLERDPRNAAGWCNLAGCLNVRRAYTDAIRSCDQALALDPTLVQAHFNRGLAQFGLRQYAEGREDMRKAQALEPSDPGVRARIQENLRLADRYLASLAKAK
ncbi:MAG: tetratricopeptide repeat protein [Acidobacteria bacterium]|nr:tetratricopeptide repeat protein [Acidobacteriota bacterium]